MLSTVATEQRGEPQTPLLLLLAVPSHVQRILFLKLDRIDSSGFVRGNFWVLLLAAVLWSVSLVSVIDRRFSLSPACRRLLEFGQPLFRFAVPCTSLLLGILVTQDALWRLLVLEDRYLCAAAQCFGGLALCVGGCATPCLRLLQVDTVVSVLSLAAGVLCSGTSWRWWHEPALLTAHTDAWKRLPCFTALFGATLSVHSLGRLLDVPLLSRVAQWSGDVLSTAWCGAWFLVERGACLLQWISRRVIRLVQPFTRWLVGKLLRVLNVCARVVQVLGGRLWTVARRCGREVLRIARLCGTSVQKLLGCLWKVARRCGREVLRIAKICGTSVQKLLWCLWKVARRCGREVLRIARICGTSVQKLLGCLRKVARRCGREVLRTAEICGRSVQKLLNRLCTVVRRCGREVLRIAEICGRSVQKLLDRLCTVVRRCGRELLRVAKISGESVQKLLGCLWTVARRCGREALRVAKICREIVQKPLVRFWTVARRFGHELLRIVKICGKCVQKLFVRLWTVARRCGHELLRIVKIRVESASVIVRHVVEAFLSILQQVIVASRVPVLRVCLRIGACLRRLLKLLSPCGCFVSAGLFTFNCWRHVTRGNLTCFVVLWYVVAAFHPASVGVLLLGRLMRTERRFVRAGEYLELLGTNLFLEADHVLLSGAWWLVRRGGLLVRAALDCLRLAMDGVLAVITECWRFLWSCVEMCLDGLLQSVLYLVSNVWRMGLFVVNAAVKTTWQHPEAGALLGTVVVACALLVHHDSVPNPLALAWLLDAAPGSRELASTVLVAVTAAGRGPLGEVWRVLCWLYTVLGSAGRHVAADASSVAVTLSTRPLALFAQPAFAFFAAVIDVLFSLSAFSLRGCAPAERAELAARAGRSSQRFLLVPVLGAAVCNKHVARLMPCVVCLAVLYMLLSLWAFLHEMSTWRRTQSALSQSRAHAPEQRSNVQVPPEVFALLTQVGETGKVFIDRDTECSICLEPLCQEPSEPLEPLGERVSVCVLLKNGPRDLFRAEILAELHVWVVDPSEQMSEAPQRAVRTESTRSGSWRLRLFEGRTYRVNLVQSNSRTQVPLQTSLLLHVALPSSTAGSSSASVDLRQGYEETWTFRGKRRADENELSGLTFALVDETLAMESTDSTLGSCSSRVQDVPQLEVPLVEGLAPPEQEDNVFLRCGHPFHQPCIEQWLLQQKCCPLCRERVDGRGRRLQALF